MPSYTLRVKNVPFLNMSILSIPVTFPHNLANLPKREGGAFESSLMVLARAKALWCIATGSGSLVAAQFIALVLWLQPGSEWLSILLMLLLGIGCLSLAMTCWRLYRGLLLPLQILEDKVERVCQGDFRVRMDAKQIGGLGNFAETIQNLNDELVDLYEDMDSRVAHQTKRLAQKTASLNILYEAAASINQIQDQSTLLIRYLRVFKEMVNGRAATVRLIAQDGREQLLACIDSNNKIFLEHELLPLPLCKCGRILIPGDILCERDAKECSKRLNRPMYGLDEIEFLDVPLQYHSERLGNYRIWVDRLGMASREDMRDILATIGRHLGVAIAKHRSDIQARRLSIIEERNHLAHELHDSLAQTLASLRFRVRLLQETLTQNVEPHSDTLTEVQRIRNAIDGAHTELRELLNSFRAPIDQSGLVPALERLIAKFQQETKLAVFLQQECCVVPLTAHEEAQMLRIVQEALTNIRKHAQAHTVRVLLRCHAPGSYLLLVEDDGVGFQRANSNANQPGEHLGLAIMEERARRIGATLRIETDPGEGTRIEFIFKPGRRPMSMGADY